MSHFDILVFVVDAELFQRPIGDILASIRTVLVVNVERKALVAVGRGQMQLGNALDHQRAENARNPISLTPIT